MLFVAIAVTLVVVPALVVLALRHWGQQDAQTETRLHSTQTHTVSYDVPSGQDPAPLRTALNHAHFSNALGHGDSGRSLIVECDEADRSRVRSTDNDQPGDGDVAERVRPRDGSPLALVSAPGIAFARSISAAIEAIRSFGLAAMTIGDRAIIVTALEAHIAVGTPVPA